MEIDHDKVGMLLQKLPTDIVFIFKAVHHIGVHNYRAKGTSRSRLLTFTKYACEGLAQGMSPLYVWWLKFVVWMRLFVFEKSFWVFDKVFGFKNFSAEFAL